MYTPQIDVSSYRKKGKKKGRNFVDFSVSVFLILIIFFPFIYGLGSVDKKKEKENVNFGEIFRLFFTLYVLI